MSQSNIGEDYLLAKLDLEIGRSQVDKCLKFMITRPVR